MTYRRASAAPEGLLDMELESDHCVGISTDLSALFILTDVSCETPTDMQGILIVCFTLLAGADYLFRESI